MVLGNFSTEDVLLIFAIYLLGAYFVADYLFTILWRKGFQESSKKLYFTKLMASTNTATSPLVRNDVPDGSPFRENFYRLTGKDRAFISEQPKFGSPSADTSDAITLLDSELNEKGLPRKRSSRHGLFDDKNDDTVSFDQLYTREKRPSDECSVAANLESSVGKLSHQKEHTSPTSSGGDSQEFHFRYNRSMSHATPFSPMYNLPNISPYPTPYIRKGQNDEFVTSSASLSEDTADTPFRPSRPFGSPTLGYDQQSHRKRMDEQTVYFNESDIQELKLTTSNFEMKIASELVDPESAASTYSDPLDKLTARFRDINAKEKHQSEEIRKAVNRLSAMSSVEAEKRDLLFREFEEQDRASRDEAVRVERARIESLRREKEAAEVLRRMKEEELRIQEEKAASDKKIYLAHQVASSQPPINGSEAGRYETIGILNPVKKAASDTAKVSKNPILSDNSIKSPYVLDALALVQWLNDSEGRVQSVDLPVEISGYLSQLEGQLLGFGGSTTSITEGGAMEEEKQGDAVTTNIKGMLALTSTAQKLLRVGAALGGDAFLKVLCSLLRAAVGCVCEGTRVAYVTLVGNIIVGMFLVLPTESSAQGGEGGPSLQKQGAMVFKAILYGESALCIPYSEGAEDRTRQKRRLAAVELLGALIGTQSKNSPVSVEEGWTWLIRVGKQLERAAASSNSNQFQECCISLLLFLRQGSAALIARFGWKTVEKVFQAVRTVASVTDTPTAPIDKKGMRDSDACKQLVGWLDGAIKTEGVKCALSLRHHEPHVMASYLIISSVEDARIESEAIDRDKGGQIMSKIKQLRIHTIPGIYNRLSASSTSQTLVVTQLLEKIVAASKERIPELLRYTLCKVAAQLVSQAQSEFFIIEDEAQSLPIARVAVGLCQIKPEIADIIKAEYFRICPLTVPRQAEGGLTGDDVFENMGFLRLRDTDGWEDSEQWLVRVSKVLCAFAVTLIQPEGVPFCLADGWAWLTNMINACSRLPNPSSYTADALDIFLRIVTPTMISKYGRKFMDLLLITERELLPKLKEGSSRVRLKEFLQVARESNGANFLPFFKKVQIQN